MRWVIGFWIMNFAVAIIGDHMDPLAFVAAIAFIVAGLTILPPLRRHIARECDWRVLALATPVSVMFAFALVVAHVAMFQTTD